MPELNELELVDAALEEGRVTASDHGRPPAPGAGADGARRGPARPEPRLRARDGRVGCRRVSAARRDPADGNRRARRLLVVVRRDRPQAELAVRHRRRRRGRCRARRGDRAGGRQRRHGTPATTAVRTRAGGAGHVERARVRGPRLGRRYRREPAAPAPDDMGHERGARAGATVAAAPGRRRPRRGQPPHRPPGADHARDAGRRAPDRRRPDRPAHRPPARLRAVVDRSPTATRRPRRLPAAHPRRSAAGDAARAVRRSPT